MIRGLTGEVDLSDESDTNLSSKLGGMLTFEEESQDVVETVDRISVSTSSSMLSVESGNSGDNYHTPVEGGRRLTGTRIVFEVVSARTVNNISKKFVAYTLLIKKTPGLDKSPAVIERRYSDFLKLFLNLKRRYMEVLKDVTYFPKKTVLGNFKPEIITMRSRAFEEFLAHIYSQEETRSCSELTEFLYGREMAEAHSHLRCGQFEDALPLLENAYFLQEKVIGECDLVTLGTLCEVIATQNALDNVTEAHKFAQVALRQFSLGGLENSELYPPLVQLSIRLCWSLGKDKRELEHKLGAIRNSSLRGGGECLPTLLDLIMKRCK